MYDATSDFCKSCEEVTWQEIRGDRLVCKECLLERQRLCTVCCEPVLAARLLRRRFTCSKRCGNRRLQTDKELADISRWATRLTEIEAVRTEDPVFANRVIIGFRLLQDDYHPGGPAVASGVSAEDLWENFR